MLFRSKLRWRLQDASLAPITLPEAFYLATRGGGAFFGKVGAFESGFEFDALVLDDAMLPCPFDLSPLERLTRVCAAPRRARACAVCSRAPGRRQRSSVPRSSAPRSSAHPGPVPPPAAAPSPPPPSSISPPSGTFFDHETPSRKPCAFSASG